MQNSPLHVPKYDHAVFAIKGFVKVEKTAVFCKGNYFSVW